jgi:hypothetical protein
MQTPSTKADDDRLRALEISQKKMRWLTVGLFLTTILLAGETVRGGRSGKTIEAESFVVRDKAGHVRGRFGLAGDGLPELMMFDEKGDLQVALHVYADDCSSLTFNSRNQTRVQLDSTSEGSASFRMFDKSTQSHATMFMWGDGRTGLAFDHSKESVLMGISPTQSAGIQVTDREGNQTGTLGGKSINAQTLGLVDYGGILGEQNVDQSFGPPQPVHSYLQEAAKDAIIPGGRPYREPATQSEARGASQ